MDIDIIAIDNKIQQYFQNESKNIAVYMNKISEIKKILDTQTNLDFQVRQKLQKSIEQYEKLIDSITNEQSYFFYMTESLPIMEQYKKLLRTPLKMVFLGSCKTDNTEKEKLVNDFLQVSKKYFQLYNTLVNNTNLSLSSNSNISKKCINPLSCENCKKKNIILSDGIVYLCIDCGYEKQVFTNILSYKDISRTNILQKYSYERRSHFRDCINQFQGKQNCKIDKKIYDDLEEQLEKHHLLQGDRNTPKEIRFKKVKKEHIMLFLKELHFDKQYENINYIYSLITGSKCPDISHIEDQLMADFDVLVKLYIKKFKYERKIDRKSFMNIQYVFFQLLNKNKYPCRKEDFNILKTIDRKAFHDEVFKELFEELGWNHTPFF